MNENEKLTLEMSIAVAMLIELLAEGASVAQFESLRRQFAERNAELISNAAKRLTNSTESKS